MLAVDHALYDPPRYIAGLDVGKLSDYTALTILDREMRLLHGQLEPYFFAGWLERFKLGMPYPLMVAAVRKRLERFGKDCVLVIDVTGVGQAVGDMFREGWTDYDRLRKVLLPSPNKPAIVNVTITRSDRDAHNTNWDNWYVPRLELGMTLAVTMQERRLDMAEDLKEYEAFMSEAKNFKWKPETTKADDPYLSWRSEQGHDDLVFAVAIAVWWGQKYAPRSLPSAQGQYAKPTGNALLRAGWRVA